MPGDELYFFGFSRGAYTARATAGLVASVGICTNPMLDSFYKMYGAYRLREPGQKLEDTAWGKSDDGAAWRLLTQDNVIIKVVGVFDTVSTPQAQSKHWLTPYEGGIPGISGHWPCRRGELQQEIWLPRYQSPPKHRVWIPCPCTGRAPAAVLTDTMVPATAHWRPETNEEACPMLVPWHAH